MTTEAVVSTSNCETASDVRRMFYKKPIKKDNLKLDIDYNTSQERRRKILLEYQKRFREEAFNVARGYILQETYFPELEDDEYMDVESYLSNSKPCRKYRYRKHQVMLSEWMLEVPEDFTEKWIMVPCPRGKRTILVAGKGITKAYTRKGRLCASFRSALPGGNPSCNMHHFAIVDCIWIKSEKLYYALDVLAWRNQSITNCEAEFRLCWIKQQLDEIEAENNGNATYKYPILPIPSINCDSDIASFLKDNCALKDLDGFLFFHRNAQYSLGYTPLVTWLKPFMLSEVLGISCEFYEKPEGYIDYRHYICQNSKRRKKTIPQNFMEVVENET